MVRRPLRRVTARAGTAICAISTKVHNQSAADIHSLKPDTTSTSASAQEQPYGGTKRGL